MLEEMTHLVSSGSAVRLWNSHLSSVVQYLYWTLPLGTPGIKKRVRLLFIQDMYPRMLVEKRLLV
jgi:hypothetical protein